MRRTSWSFEAAKEALQPVTMGPNLPCGETSSFCSSSTAVSSPDWKAPCKQCGHLQVRSGEWKEEICWNYIWFTISTISTDLHQYIYPYLSTSIHIYQNLPLSLHIFEGDFFSQPPFAPPTSRTRCYGCLPGMPGDQKRRCHRCFFWLHKKKTQLKNVWIPTSADIFLVKELDFES